MDAGSGLPGGGRREQIWPNGLRIFEVALLSPNVASEHRDEQRESIMTANGVGGVKSLAGPAVFALFLVLFLSRPCVADIYRFVDENQIVHLTNVPVDSHYQILIREKASDVIPTRDSEAAFRFIPICRLDRPDRSQIWGGWCAGEGRYQG